MGRKKKNAQKTDAKNTVSKIKPCLGFRFTEEEEYIMWLHTKMAERFMAKYGQGQMPLRDGFPISRKKPQAAMG